MPNAALNAVTAPDAYSNSATIGPAAPIDHINIDVANQGIYWQLAERDRSGVSAGFGSVNEVYMPPGSRTLARPNMLGIRIRAAIPAAQLPTGVAQAVVTVEAVYA